jgi:Lrp/AsnC family transcriptional regulator for asnA, asnC and gidA
MGLMLTKNGSNEGQMSCELDAVDRQIIRVLQQDGRTTNVEIARQVGVSEPTVRKRLSRLLSARMIRITAMPDASRVGFSTIAFVTLSVDLARAGQIADEIARLPEVRTIHVTTGGSELLVEAWLTSSDDLLRFMTQHIGGIPGIRRTATSHVLKTIKDGSGWVLPFSSRPGQASGGS